jgi:acyl-coenzyme A synthetase/AMP-(fatty) acid ligase
MSVEAGSMSASSFPVLRHGGSSPIFVNDDGGPITVARFLADVAALAERLPNGEHVVNLCADRYRFTVGLVAALQRRQVTLLPSSEASAPLTKLVREYRRLYFLHDKPFVSDEEQMSFPFPRDLAGPATATIPEFPSERQAAILFTSGSTGAPMPHPRSWGALVNSTRAAARKLGIAELSGANLLGTVPHQHSYGIESIIMLALQHGFVLHGARSLLPADIVAQLERMSEPRILVTTPIHLRSLVAHDGALPPIHRILCATAPLVPDLARRAQERFGAQLHEIYGCSEVGQIATRRTVDTLEWTCIDGIELHECSGDVWVSGEAAAVEMPLNDVIDLRSSKRFFLHGRKSDMVNIAGKRSSLSYLNHHLNAIDGVRDGVFIVPEGNDGVARLAAYVVAPQLSSAEILAALRRHVDSAFLPRPIHFVDSLPRNSLGKLSRHATEQLALKPLTADEAWSSVEHRFEPDHPTRAGHFPGNPIIPGALLLHHALRAIAEPASSDLPREIRLAKFFRPVRPGDRVTIRWQKLENGEVAFECRLSHLDELALAGTLKSLGK